MLVARESFPQTISQRGLSGIKNMIKKKNKAGRVSIPNIPRHTSETKIRFIQPSVTTALLFDHDNN